MKLELKIELDTEQESDEILIHKLLELLEHYPEDIFSEENVDKT